MSKSSSWNQQPQVIQPYLFKHRGKTYAHASISAFPICTCCSVVQINFVVRLRCLSFLLWISSRRWKCKGPQIQKSMYTIRLVAITGPGIVCLNGLLLEPSTCRCSSEFRPNGHGKLLSALGVGQLWLNFQTENIFCPHIYGCFCRFFHVRRNRTTKAAQQVACVAGGSGWEHETFCGEAANSLAGFGNSTRLLPIFLATCAAFCTRVRDRSSRGYPTPAGYAGYATRRTTWKKLLLSSANAPEILSYFVVGANTKPLGASAWN